MAAHASLDSSVDILRSLVAFDTTSNLSNLDCIAYIEAYLSEHGISSERLENEDGTKASLIATLGEEKDGGIVFSGHTDVVPVEGQPWETDPFDLLDADDGNVYGRGTCDMKGFIACVLAMVPWFKAHATCPIHFAFSYDEEVGCLAAPALAKHMAAQPFKPAMVVIGEPTEMLVIDAHKGVHSFETKITGLAGHSSKPHLGVNAVMAGAELVHVLNTVAEAYKAPSLCNDHFDPPYTTINIGKFHGGTARNILADHCEFIWEVRPLPGHDVGSVLERLAQRSDELLEDMRRVFPEASIKTELQSVIPGLKPEEDNPHAHHVLHAADKNGTQAVPFGTEAGIFQANGFHTIICGPGSINQAHKANEFVAREQLAACLLFLEKLTAL